MDHINHFEQESGQESEYDHEATSGRRSKKPSANTSVNESVPDKSDLKSRHSQRSTKSNITINRIIKNQVISLTPLKTDLKNLSSEKHHPTKKPKKRNQNYICLCWKCLSYESCVRCPCICCIDNVCGSPFYIWFSLGLLGVAAIAAIVWFSLSIHLYNNTNRSYFALCNSTTDCDISLGLNCAIENNLCGCPANKTKGRCDCNTGLYWNGKNCSPIMSINSSGCVFDYYCDRTKNLLCINRTCQCKWPMSWDAARNICDYQYIGCYWVNVGGQTMRTENLNVGELNFVESCINVCNRLSIKYAIIYSSNSDNFCVCSATGYTPAQASACCNIICTSTIQSSGRLCGAKNTGSYQCKTVYLAD